MNTNKILMLMKMAFDGDVMKGLYRTYNILKEDKNFNMIKFVTMMTNMLKGEKILKHEGQYILSTFMPPFPSESFYTNIMAVKEPKDIFTQQSFAKRSAPISIYLSVTHKCPNNCLYCSADNKQDERELTTEEWIRVIKDLQDMNTSIIGLTGGEPMIREDIFGLVEAIDKRSTAILFTSGLNLTLEKARELKRRGLFSIGISLDSHDRKIHNKNRRDDRAFDRALQAMQNAKEAGLYTMAQTVILKEHLQEEELFKLFRLAKENGAHEVKILEPILSGSLLKEENLDKILYDGASRKKLMEIQHKANRRREFPKISTFAYTESEEKFGCGAGAQHSYVSAGGHLYPCDFIPMSFGNVTERSIKELWQEMSAAIGTPKIGCFAQKINRRVYQASEGKLPLNKKQSEEICLENRSSTFPQYYKSLQ
ncbi:radical SAM additional 4Fe4S-binding SPASM domain-containing protein [Natronincola peptidivorans]|uniref:Radical SAM additional 4Fe4S-binding SPASM domain-containing protein n=1 Tax=Natronincola peptidivorans TaxID=426128 RepID=A0A1I0GXS8_9FIRM|nr:radical SAM protein [Natronincola peptidivorans]SET76059.1 radical SAM additional 4Fe4S-binding SPASM domain-containing protein [Natronincola peptidivorans]